MERGPIVALSSSWLSSVFDSEEVRVKRSRWRGKVGDKKSSDKNCEGIVGLGDIHFFFVHSFHKNIL